jgi:aldehyde dehydrogenase (NAD+)
MEDAGIPAGVVNFVTGSGGEAGMPLVTHPDVRVISFTGSVEVGREINGAAARMMKRTCCELGGKNAIIVMDDADIDLLVDGVCWGAFGTTGQRCTATSRLIVHKKVHDEFMQKFTARAKRLTLGDGRDESIDVGPVVNAGRVKAIDDYVRIGKKEAKLVLGGEPAAEGALKRGAFYRPTIFDGVKPSARIAKEEIFGPVVSVLTCSSLEDAVAIANDVEYGLSSSIYTKDITSAFRAIEDLETGIVYVNAPTIGAEAHLPFGGWKNTGNGHREGAHTIYDVFCEWKTVYVDYSGRLQRAQIDNVESAKK